MLRKPQIMYTVMIHSHERAYISPPGLYDAEIGIMRDEVSLTVCAQYHHLVHVPSLEHRMPPALRHVGDEIAHCVIWLESPPPNSLLSLVSSARTFQPSSCILGFLLGDELSHWLVDTTGPSSVGGGIPSPPFTPRIHLPHTGSMLTIPVTSELRRIRSWTGDWVPPRLRMCARILACLRLSHIVLARNGLLAVIHGFYDAFVHHYFPHRPARPGGSPPILFRASRFSARLAVLSPDGIISTSIPIAFDSYEWAVAHNITSRAVNGARQRYIIHEAQRFASHDLLDEPWEPEGYLEGCGRAARYRVTWKIMTTFGIWASGSSTLATSAAVKADSTLPARANQARFDTNEHANYFFF